MSEYQTRCPSCGVPWDRHTGIQGSCRHLHSTRLLLKDASTLIVELSRALKKRTDDPHAAALSAKALDWINRNGI
jgi:hypothetical protein